MSFPRMRESSQILTSLDPCLRRDDTENYFKIFKMHKILLIEDEEALQKSLSKALEDEGFNVVGAYDGKTGLGLALKEKPDLILLDLILPQMDGFEVLRELKKSPETKNISVMILTNLEQTQNVEKTIEFGPLNYLVKANYNLDEIVEKIKESLK